MTSPDHPLRGNPNSDRATILVVDDNPVNVDLLESMLAEQGFEVAVAFDGDQALALAPRLLPDVILLDVDMPGRSGFETCVALKADPVTNSIPVIFVTAMKHQLGRGFASGGVDYIAKPITRTELLARLNTHLMLRRTLDQLERARGSLELEVAERTRELRETNERLKSEIDVRRHVEERLAYLARHDLQTGLPNPTSFAESATAYLRGSRSDAPYALVVLTVEGLQLLRDVIGTGATDEVLRLMAVTVRKAAVEPRYCARLAPDRFALLCAGDVETSAEAAERLIASLKQAAAGAGEALDSLLLYADVMPTGDATTDVVDLIELATTLERGEGRRQGELRRHSAQSVGEVAEDREVLARLRGNLDEAGLELWRQPIYRVSSPRGAPNHYEVLLRMIDSDGRRLSPARFLGLAERYRLMERIDRWVLARVVAFLVSDPLAPRHDVNLSAQAAASPGFGAWSVRHVRARLDRPERLGVEITESAAIRYLDVASCLLRDLRHMGCSCALDDFGTGHASYGYLKDLPLDSLKIDGSFVREVPHDRVSTHLVKSMCAVGRALGLSVVAEQVESPDSLESLQRLGATHVQGYLTGRPAPLPACPATEAGA